MESSIKERIVLEYEANPCFFSAYFIDAFIVLMGFWLSYVAFIQYIWWSYPLSLIILLVMLGLGKSLFLSKVTLDDKKLILEYAFFNKKILYLDKVKELRFLNVGFFCMKYTFLEKKPFDYKSIWLIVNESILGTEAFIELEQEIKKLIKGK